MTAKPGAVPHHPTIARRLTAAGFKVTPSEHGSHNYADAPEGARIHVDRQRRGEVHWSTAVSDFRGPDSEYYQHNAPRYGAAYASLLADFYNVRLSDDSRYVYLTQLDEAPKVAKDAVRVAPVVEALKQAGIKVAEKVSIFHYGFDVLVYQRLDCTEAVAGPTGWDDTHEAATERTTTALREAGFTVEPYDRVDTIVLRVTAHTEPEKDTATVTAQPAVPEPEIIDAEILDATPGVGARPSHVDHPVIRAIVADLIDAGHTPSRVTDDDSDDHTPGFFVGLREHDRVMIWWYLDEERTAFLSDQNGAPLWACFYTLTKLRWAVTSGSRVIEVHDTEPPAAPKEITPEVHEGYAPQDAAKHPQVLAAVKVLTNAAWKPARIVDNEVRGRGFIVTSGYKPDEVHVSTYFDGKLVDLDNDTEDEWADTHLGAYEFELHAAGWETRTGSSHSVKAIMPAPAAETVEPPVETTRYAYQVQTRLNEGPWQDVDVSGVATSVLHTSARFGARLLVERKADLPPVNSAREVRVMVWGLDTPGEPPAEVHADHLRQD